MKMLIAAVAAVALAAGCQPKAPADDAPVEAAAPAEKAAPEATPEKAPAAAADTAPEPPAAGDDQPAGFYLVRASNADKAALVPTEGDHVVHAQGPDGTWYLLGIDGHIALDRVAAIETEPKIGGTHFRLGLDDAGSAALKAMTEANMGKRMAVVVAGKVVIAPEIKAVIDGGRIQVSCGSLEKPCHEAMALLDPPLDAGDPNAVLEDGAEAEKVEKAE